MLLHLAGFRLPVGHASEPAPMAPESAPVGIVAGDRHGGLRRRLLLGRRGGLRAREGRHRPPISGYAGGTRRLAQLRAGEHRHDRPRRVGEVRLRSVADLATASCSRSSSRSRTIRRSSTARAPTSARSTARRSSTANDGAAARRRSATSPSCEDAKVVPAPDRHAGRRRSRRSIRRRTTTRTTWRTTRTSRTS